MNVKPLRTLQTALGLTGNAVEGRYGPPTAGLVNSKLQALNPVTKTDWRAWPQERQTLLCLQALCVQDGFHVGELDGLWGPQTAFAVDQLAYQQAHGVPPAPWRTESVAPDFNPDHNQLKWGAARARFAQPDCDAWWQCWELEGWVSLGRTRNYDWMHVHAARV